MKAQKKRSRLKERFTYYKGQEIWTNTPYAYGLGKHKIGLFYCPVEGVELYFTSVGKAKRYLDSIQHKIKPIEGDIPF